MLINGHSTVSRARCHVDPKVAAIVNDDPRLFVPRSTPLRSQKRFRRRFIHILSGEARPICVLPLNDPPARFILLVTPHILRAQCVRRIRLRARDVLWIQLQACQALNLVATVHDTVKGLSHELGPVRKSASCQIPRFGD